MLTFGSVRLYSIIIIIPCGEWQSGRATRRESSHWRQVVCGHQSLAHPQRSREAEGWQRRCPGVGSRKNQTSARVMLHFHQEGCNVELLSPLLPTLLWGSAPSLPSVAKKGPWWLLPYLHAPSCVYNPGHYQWMCLGYIACAWDVATLTAHNSDTVCECPCTLKPVSFHVAQHTWNITYKYTRECFQTHVCVHIHSADPMVSYLAISIKTVKKLTTKKEARIHVATSIG